MQSFYFYDLETSGLSPSRSRIMQFAGQRTDMDLTPLGEPDNMLVRLTPDNLPSPEALLVTGITPQQTLTDGVSEKDFVDYFLRDIAREGTTFVGFNTIRFDDEFIRYTLYRNLSDPYEWQWKDGRSRWDLLDVVRMTRALRPEGISWPVSADGTPANRLEMLTASNNLDHDHAHNALSDVKGSIALAQLLRNRQPKLFDYLFSIRDKQSVAALLNSGQPLVYTSGRYPSECEKTAVVIPLGPGPEVGTHLVYDLRIDPVTYLDTKTADSGYEPIKLVKHNRCPALAPLSVVDEASWKRIGLHHDLVMKHLEGVREHIDALRSRFSPRVYEKPSSVELFDLPLLSVDGALYDGFVSAADKKLCERIVALRGEELTDCEPVFEDKRLSALYFLYKARQFPKNMLSEDREKWEQYVSTKLLDGGERSEYAQFMATLEELAGSQYLDADKRYVLEELALYAQSIVPSDGY